MQEKPYIFMNMHLQGNSQNMQNYAFNFFKFSILV